MPTSVKIGIFNFLSQTNIPAQLTDSSARTTAAFPCDGCVMATMTAAMTRTNPTPPVRVCRSSKNNLLLLLLVLLTFYIFEHVFINGDDLLLEEVANFFIST